MAKTDNKTNDALNQDVLQFLRQDELDYAGGAKKFGPNALPFLQELIDSNDEMLATKAAYLAGYIGGAGSQGLLKAAVSNKFSTVRIAAAFSAQSQDTKTATDILSAALDDNDPGVVKLAMKSVASKNLGTALKAKLQAVAKRAPTEDLKLSAAEMVKNIR
jgi:hypothetical protein